MSKQFTNTEKELQNIFQEGCVFIFKGKKYRIITSGKPRPSIGECKTDLYLRTESETKELEEFKISVKQNNYDFYENKMKLDRAKEIFGDDAQTIIKSSILKIKQYFLSDFLVYFDNKGKVEKNSITLGWKFELVKRKAGSKSDQLEINFDQIVDIISGTNLKKERRNCNVNGEVVPDSGVANYVLSIPENEQFEEDCGYYANKFVTVEQYSKNIKVFYACKALNYRASKDKWDGPRALAVFIKWKLDNNKKIHAEIILDHPLTVDDNIIGKEVKAILNILNINNNNFPKLAEYLHPSIKIYKK